jgi:methionyl aminopeptidase
MSGVVIKEESEIDIMREAGSIVCRCLDHLESILEAGMSTWDLDQEAEQFIAREGATPAFKGYRGFPGVLCTSVNEEIVHGIPSKDKVLGSGDIISVDVGVKWRNYYGDHARTFAVGEVSPDCRKLMSVCRESLLQGVRAVTPGAHLFDISRAIEEYIRPFGYGIVEDFVGHGIGTDLHEAPQIPNYVDPSRRSQNIELKPGMVFAIEPMVNLGSKRTRSLSDGWTVVTADGERSAHFEHTVAVTENGYEVLTAMDNTTSI